MIMAKTRRRDAAFDLALIVGALLVAKAALLRIDAIWAFAGPLSVTLALGVALWRLRVRNFGLPAIGLARPHRLWRLAAFTVLALVVTIFAGEVARAAAVAWLGTPDSATQAIAARDQDRFSSIPGNPVQFALWLTIAWIMGGFFEEILFRGALFARLETMLAGAPFAALLAGFGQAFLFGQQHFYYQGAAGWVATGIIAFVSSLLFLAFRRNLWPLIISHGLSNSIGLTVLFLQAPG